MFNRSAIIALAGSALAHTMFTPRPPTLPDNLVVEKPKRVRRGSYRTGKGQQDKPRKRTNMVRLSRRVRRKHRRAA